MKALLMRWVFRVMLWALGWRMTQRSKSHEKFRAKLKDKDIILQFRTEDGKVARHYIVQDQTVRSVRGLASEPSFTLSFKDATAAVETIIAGAKDQTAFMKGVQAQKIQASGDFSLMMWFMSIAKYLGP